MVDSFPASTLMQQAAVDYWFCVRTQAKHEHIAAARLREIGGVEVFCPRIRLRRRTRRGPVWFVEAMFPGYLFAKFDLAERLRVVRSSHGVTGLVQFADRFATVQDDVIAGLGESLDPSGMATMDYTITQGDTVRIAEGAFTGLEAVVTKVMAAKDRVRVLLEFLGREVEAEVDKDAVLPRAAHPIAA